MARSRKVVSTSRAESRLYLAKAKEFLEEAKSALAESRDDAAMLNAVHAAISAADAATAALAGVRSADPDHHRSADLLEESVGATKGGKAPVQQLRRLIAAKNATKYSSRRATAAEAKEQVTRAERFVRWASDAVGK